jgi:hypothetical protein
MLKLIFIVLPLVILLFICWRFSSLRSSVLLLLLATVALIISFYSMSLYGVSLKDFLLLSHNRTLLTIELIITLVLFAGGLLQLTHVLKKK